MSARRISQLRAIIAARPAGDPEREIAEEALEKALENEPVELGPLEKLKLSLGMEVK